MLCDIEGVGDGQAFAIEMFLTIALTMIIFMVSCSFRDYCVSEYLYVSRLLSKRYDMRISGYRCLAQNRTLTFLAPLDPHGPSRHWPYPLRRPPCWYWVDWRELKPRPLVRTGRRFG